MTDPVFHFEDILIGLPLMMRGLLYTLALALGSFGFALVAGTGLALLREELGGGPGRLWAGKLAAVYTDFLRGIPLILFLIFIHYGLMPLFFSHTSFLLSSLLAFMLFESAYVGEIVRSGLRAVHRTEREAAQSLGLNTRQQLRLVILPLAYRRMMPALVGQFMTLIKDTSLASVVGVIELTRAGEIIYEQRFHDLEILLFQASVYFLLCFSLSLFARRFESPEQRLELQLARSIS